jgi:hypothetical protein
MNVVVSEGSIVRGQPVLAELEIFHVSFYAGLERFLPPVYSGQPCGVSIISIQKNMNVSIDENRLVVPVGKRVVDTLFILGRGDSLADFLQ